MNILRRSKVIFFIVCLGLLMILGSVTCFAENTPEIYAAEESVNQNGSYYVSQKLSEIVDLEEFEKVLYEGTYNCKKVIDISKFKIPYSEKDFLTEYIFKEMVFNYHFDDMMITHSNNIISEIKPNYDYTPEQYQKMVADIEKAKEEILIDIKDNSNLGDVEKALLIHDRLALMCEYDFNFASESYSLYGALVNGKAVCEGYTKAYDYLLKEVGIESYYCSSINLSHAWNIVFVNDIPYHVDVTWDDEYWKYGERGVLGAVSHENFLRSSQGIFSTGHCAIDYDTFPVDTTYDNYFWKNSHTAFQLLDNKIYYIDNETEQLVCFSDQQALCSVSALWHNYENVARLSCGNGELYYSSSRSIYRYDIATGTSDVIFEPSLDIYENIYGFEYIGTDLVCDINYRVPEYNTLYQIKEYYDSSAPVSIKEIKITAIPTKTTYYLGDALDLKGLKIKASYTGSPIEVVSEGYIISGFDSESEGTKTVVISYKGQSESFDVEVKTPRITFWEDNLELSPGMEYKIKLSVEPSSQIVRWTTTDHNVAYLKSNTIIAENYGTATITAYFIYNDVIYSKSCVVKVVSNSIPISDAYFFNDLDYSLVANLYMSDDIGLWGYYWGTTQSPSDEMYIPLNSVDKHQVQVPVVSGGTYYFSVKNITERITTRKFEFAEITLDATGGGDVPASMIVEKGISVFLPEPKKMYNMFLGWGTSPDATSYVETVSPESDVTYYAIWQANDSEDPVVSLSSTNNVASSQTVTLVMGDDIGIVSYYWGAEMAFSEDLFVKVQSSKKIVLEKTISAQGGYMLVAKDADGNTAREKISFVETTLDGKGVDVTPERIISVSHKQITLPTLTKSGYEFIGWKLYYGELHEGKEVTIITDYNRKYHAQWKLADCQAPDATITSSNKIASSQNVTIVMNDDIGVTSYYWGTDFTPDDILFTNIDAARSKTIDKTVSESGTYYLIVRDNSGKSLTKSITFYNTEFDSNGSDETAQSILTAYGNSVVMPEIKRDGYMFKGWGTSSDSESGVWYIIPSENQTYYAVWSENDTGAPVVSLLSNSHTLLGLEVVFELSDNNMLVGYDWSTSPSHVGYYVLNQSTKVLNLNVSKPGTYYLWVKDDEGNVTEKSFKFYHTFFDANGGNTGVSDIISLEGDCAKYFTTWREGYKFKGWSTTPTDTRGVTTIYPTSNETFYAVWEINPDIEISRSSLDLTKGETTSITAMPNLADQTVFWYSSDVSIATVSDGKVNAVSLGSTYIYAEFVHNGHVYFDQCKVTVTENNDSLSSISVTRLPYKITYLETKEPLDLTGGELTLYYSNDTTKVVSISETMVKGFDSTKVGEQTLTVTYGGKTTAFNVTVVEKELVSIDVYQAPDRKVYPQAKYMLNVSGGKLALNYNNGSCYVIDITPDMVSEFDNSKLGVQTLSVTYGGKTTSFDVEVIENDFTSIEVTSLPKKLVYRRFKDKLDLTGGKITLYYSDGTTRILDLAGYMVTNYNSYEVGNKTLEVVFGGKKATYDIYIYVEGLSSAFVEKLPDKLFYVEGYDEFDPTGGVVTVVYENGTTISYYLHEGMVSGFDNTKVGKQTLTVYVDGVTATFDVEVVEKSVSHIEVTTLPDKLTYLESKDMLDVTGGKITVYYNNGTTKVVDLSSDMISGFNNASLGQQKLVVSYEDCSTYYNVEILPKKLETVGVVVPPNKLKYIVGEQFDVTGGKIALYYDNNTTEVIALTADMVSGFDNSVLGEQYLVISCQGKETTLKIEVVEKSLESIKVSQLPESITYMVGIDSLDVSGGKLTLYYDNGTTEVLDITLDMVTGFDNAKLGKQTLTVNFGGKTTSYKVEVVKATQVKPSEPPVSDSEDSEDSEVEIPIIPNVPDDPSCDLDDEYTDTTEPAEPTEPTMPPADDDAKPSVPTHPSTDATEEPTKPSDSDEERDILGDVNGDGKVNIKDATIIQKAVAKLISLTDSENIRANVNGDAKVNVKDATAIQKYVAKIEIDYPIGEKVI